MPNNWTEQLTGQNGEYRYSANINPNYAQVLKQSYIIGLNGVANCDFNFAAPADALQQNLDLGLIIRANCVITKISVTCLETIGGGPADFTVSSATTSGGTNYIPVTTCKTLNVVVNSGVIPVTIDWSQVNKVFFGGKPTTSTWSVMNAGKWRIDITFNDFSKL